MPDRLSIRTPRVRPGYLALLLALVPSLAQAGENYGIAWRTDLASAQAEAHARNLPLWIQFTGPWCIYCRKMDHETFPEPGIVARSQGQFVPLKLQSNAHEDLVNRLGISGLPATVILSPSGTAILGRTAGFADPYNFAGVLDGAWSSHTASPDLLALEGFCPVRLVQGKGRVAGKPETALFHDGHVYRFADPSAKDLFLKDPEKYLPSDRGGCVVAKKDDNKKIPGDTRYGVYYQNRLYLFASEESRKKFAANPGRYSAVDIAENGECPHCKDARGEKVPGKPEFSTTLAGRRYLFPDATHRQAFLPTPDRYLR